jgi:mRNA-degrading endonuclease RelE of RelBE toxin-antitoxin system
MAYQVEIGPKASAQLSELDPTVASAVERKIIWLSQNADDMIHLIGGLSVCRMIWRAYAN